MKRHILPGALVCIALVVLGCRQKSSNSSGGDSLAVVAAEVKSSLPKGADSHAVERFLMHHMAEFKWVEPEHQYVAVIRADGTTMVGEDVMIKIKMGEDDKVRSVQVERVSK